METTIFIGDDGRQYLVTVYPGEWVRLAVRERQIESWSPPFKKVGE